MPTSNHDSTENNDYSIVKPEGLNFGLISLISSLFGILFLPILIVSLIFGIKAITYESRVTKESLREGYNEEKFFPRSSYHMGVGGLLITLITPFVSFGLLILTLMSI